MENVFQLSILTLRLQCYGNVVKAIFGVFHLTILKTKKIGVQHAIVPEKLLMICANMLDHDLRKGNCLSDKYYNRDTKLKWICEKSHIWEARPEDVLRGTWCPVCAGNISYTIEIAKQIASDRNGECLSTEYINNCSKLLWKCIEGHLWSAPLFSIKNLGNWCPYCAGNIQSTIEEAKQIAYNKMVTAFQKSMSIARFHYNGVVLKGMNGTQI
jgi:hypothetical protein